MRQSVLTRLILVGIATAVALVYLMPTLVGSLPSWWTSILPADKIHLGLDLQGGSHLVLEVKVDKAIEHHVERLRGDLTNNFREKGITGVSVERVEGAQLVVKVPAADQERVRGVIKSDFGNLTEAKTPQTDGGSTEFFLVLSREESRNLRETIVDQSLETIRNRIDQFGVSEPIIQRQGQQNILVQLPGIQDPQRAKDIIGKTALLEFKLVDDNANVEEAAKSGAPPGRQVLYGQVGKAGAGVSVEKVPYVLESRTLMTGEYIQDARVRPSEQLQGPSVELILNNQGARLFEQITAANVKRRLAIILDNSVYSAPVIQERIGGGRASITGSFDIKEARDLSIVLRAGALPAPVEIVEERTVGPSLGQDSINQGVMSFIVGGVLVIIFMIAYYKGAGLVAVVALVFNVLYMIALLAGFQAVLTLPGIAGIVLTVGMAVDANVLIHERIREELRAGRAVRSAVEAGYKNALPAILDSNVTTFLSGVILFQFGTGPIKGFAVTLCIGIVTTVITAVYLTRVYYDYRIGARRLERISIYGIAMELIRSGTKIPFTKYRKLAVILSTLVNLIVLAFLLIKGPSLGVDFAGGTMVQLKFQQKTTISDIRQALETVQLGSSVIQDFGQEGSNEFLVRVEKVGMEIGALGEQIKKALTDKFGAEKFEIRRVEFVGPKIGEDLRWRGTLSVIASTIMMGVYIWIRFASAFGAKFGLHFAVGAVIALMHDVLVTVGALMLANYEFDLTVVAALLTIVGFSVNDTVVICDRIRENLRKIKRETLENIINTSINETLSRTILTTGTALMVLTALYVLGGAVIRPFAFSLLVGFISGVYSTIFIASPVILLWGDRLRR